LKAAPNTVVASQPETAAADNPNYRQTNGEMPVLYTKLTPDLVAHVRSFIRGRTREEAATALGMTTDALTSLSRRGSGYVREDLLEKIVSPERAAHLLPGADWHTKLQTPLYRRIGDAEILVIEKFVIGGSYNEAADFLGVFGRSYTPKGIAALLTTPYSGVRYINDLDYALMSAVTHIRTHAGYYEITSDAHDPKKRALHVKITPPRRAMLQEYVNGFNQSRNNSGTNPKYLQPAEAIGINPLDLRNVVFGLLHYIPAGAYLRFLEKKGGVGIEPDDRALIPYIGQSSELERKLEDYSLETMKQTIATPLKGVCSYLKEPEKSAFAFLQRLEEPGTDHARLIDELSKYLQILEHNAVILAGVGEGEQKPTPHSDFLNYFGIPNRQPNRKR